MYIYIYIYRLLSHLFMHSAGSGTVGRACCITQKQLNSGETSQAANAINRTTEFDRNEPLHTGPCYIASRPLRCGQRCTANEGVTKGRTRRQIQGEGDGTAGEDEWKPKVQGPRQVSATLHHREGGMWSRKGVACELRVQQKQDVLNNELDSAQGRAGPTSAPRRGASQVARSVPRQNPPQDNLTSGVPQTSIGHRQRGHGRCAPTAGSLPT